jgi:hypothetical protein
MPAARVHRNAEEQARLAGAAWSSAIERRETGYTPRVRPIRDLPVVPPRPDSTISPDSSGRADSLPPADSSAQAPDTVTSADSVRASDTLFRVDTLGTIGGAS